MKKQICILALISLVLQGCFYYAKTDVDLLSGVSKDLVENIIIRSPDKSKIAVIDIDGEISLAPRSSSFFTSPSIASDVQLKLERAKNDPLVKGIILRINSPGGGVNATDTIYNEIKKFKEEKDIPIVAHCLDVAASGGYYISMPADCIISQPNTVIGSIGVIMVKWNVQGLVEEILKSEVSVLTAGDKKAMSSIFKSSSPEEAAIYQNLLDRVHERFINVVVEGRPGLSRDDVIGLADGRIYDGLEALAYNMVDRIGYFEDALDEVKTRAKTPYPNVVIYSRMGSETPVSYYTQGVYSNPVPITGNLNSRNFNRTGFTSGLIPQMYYLYAADFLMAQ